MPVSGVPRRRWEQAGLEFTGPKEATGDNRVGDGNGEGERSQEGEEVGDASTE